MRRRQWTVGALLACVSGWSVAQSVGKPSGAVVQVWKDPNCGCCKDWVAHLERNGFRTQVFETGNRAVRRRLGMPEKLGSCHTALVDGYVIEGHVPAEELRRLLQSRPDALGLSVPGMPVGAPGMDGPEYGGRKDPYGVMLVAKDGSATVYQHHP
ncbi:MAG: DUF411 domain-containing protein [Burkholderiaceae bacterium]